MALIQMGHDCEHCGGLKTKELVFVGDGPPYCLECGYANGEIDDNALKYIRKLEKAAKSKTKAGGKASCRRGGRT